MILIFLGFKFLIVSLRKGLAGNLGVGEWGMGSGEWGIGSGEWGIGSGEWGTGSGE